MPTLDLALNRWHTYAACAGQDPEMWETPGKHATTQSPETIPRARAAIAVCQTCPVARQCHADAGRPISVIRAGIPYDSEGHPMPRCVICHARILTGDIRSRYCEKHDRYDLRRLGRKAAA